jgi:nucleotide-binding universal stress UspA family protein
VESPSTSSDARVELAVGLAPRFGARLIGASAAAVIPPPVNAYGGVSLYGPWLDQAEQEIRGKLDAAEKRFREIVGAAEPQVEWRAAVDLPGDVLAREACAADLVVVGRDLERQRAGIYITPDPGDLLMRLGRPLLVVPPGTSRLSAEHILVAWKDSREARRAAWDALPFLKLAQAVHVLEVVAGEDELQAAAERVRDVARYLERHGIRAKPEVRTRREESDADELQLVARGGSDRCRRLRARAAERMGIRRRYPTSAAALLEMLPPVALSTLAQCGSDHLRTIGSSEVRERQICEPRSDRSSSLVAPILKDRA